jgi:hypothetical protein
MIPIDQYFPRGSPVTNSQSLPNLYAGNCTKPNHVQGSPASEGPHIHPIDINCIKIPPSSILSNINIRSPGRATSGLSLRRLQWDLNREPNCVNFQPLTRIKVRSAIDRTLSARHGLATISMDDRGGCNCHSSTISSLEQPSSTSKSPRHSQAHTSQPPNSESPASTHTDL